MKTPTNELRSTEGIGTGDLTQEISTGFSGELKAFHEGKRG